MPRADFPVARRARFHGHPLVYLDSRRHLAEAAPGDRGDRLATTGARTPTSTAGCTRWRGRRPSCSRAPASASPRSSDGDTDHHDLHAQRHRGDQPRGVLVGPRTRRRGRRGAHHADGAPLQHRALAAALRRRRGATPALPARVGRRAALARRARRGARAAARSSSSPSPTCPTCSARSTRSAEIAARARAAGAVSLIDGSQAVPQMPVDVRRRRRGLLRVDRPQGARARPGSACCTAAASCSSRCGRSSAAAT